MENNEQNKLMSKIESEAWKHSTDSCKRQGGRWRLVKRKVYVTYGQGQQCGDCLREWGGGAA